MSQRKPKKAAPASKRPESMAQLRRALSRRKKAELVDTLLELAQADRGVLRQLTARFDVAAAPDELVAATRQAIADATAFDERDSNRIISGWSHGILVVEAGVNSGALITASQAIEQGRSVYAVPGHINAPTAIGSNRLIQQGAKLVMDASDILDDLEILLPEKEKLPAAAVRPLPQLGEEERRVYEAIRATETPIDQISAASELPAATVSSLLLQLELKRLVKQLPGKYFVKIS